MNCKDVKVLLPLYVGRDLKESRAKLVTAHVQSCVECAISADEYRESRQLLQEFAPPPVSEAVYAGIRQRVLREIEREAAAPGSSRLLANLFRPGLRFAVATALLLAVLVFGFYFIANRSADLRNDRQQVAGSGRAVDRITGDEQGRSRDSAVSTSSPGKKGVISPLNSTARNAGADITIAGSVDRARQSQRRKRFGAAADRTRSVAVNAPDTRPMTAAMVSELNNPAESDTVPARDSAASEKPLRVEMQTKDPNIRIIWFSHQRTKQDFPSKSSKGI